MLFRLYRRFQVDRCPWVAAYWHRIGETFSGWVTVRLAAHGTITALCGLRGSIALVMAGALVARMPPIKHRRLVPDAPMRVMVASAALRSPCTLCFLPAMLYCRCLYRTPRRPFLYACPVDAAASPCWLRVSSLTRTSRAYA
jgi:hypothetical protein